MVKPQGLCWIKGLGERHWFLINGSIAVTKHESSITYRPSQDRIVAQACDLLGQQITAQNLRLANLATMTGFSTIRIKSLLDRRQNPRIRDIAAIAHALNGRLSIQFHSIGNEDL
jgi:hypothetical protein